MARGKNKGMSSDFSGSPLEQRFTSGVNSKIDDIPVKKEAKPDLDIIKESLPKKEDNKTIKVNSGVKAIDAIMEAAKDDVKEEEYMVYAKLEGLVGTTLKDLFRNPDGSFVKGGRGLRTKVIYNGVLKELVAIGALDESELELLKPYI